METDVQPWRRAKWPLSRALPPIREPHGRAQSVTICVLTRPRPGVDLPRQMGVVLIGLRKETGHETTPDHSPAVAVSGFTHHGQRYPRAPSEVHLVPFGSVTPPVASAAT